jgi:hypothetical protein
MSGPGLLCSIISAKQEREGLKKVVKSTLGFALERSVFWFSHFKISQSLHF